MLQDEISNRAASGTMLATDAARQTPSHGLLKWAGSKAPLAKTIVPLIEARKPSRLIEPFAGGASIFFRSGQVPAILGDCNDNLIGFFTAVKNDPVRIFAALEKISTAAQHLTGPDFKAFYYDLRQELPRADLFENAALFLFLNRHCWNGLYRENIQGNFNTPIGSYQTIQPFPSLEQFEYSSKRLARASLMAADFCVTAANARPGDLVYFDPPYMRTSSTARFSHYNGAAFSWRDQVRLKRLLYDLRERKIDFILSNSYQKLTTAFYADFPQYIVSSPSPINSRGSLRQPRKELLVMSFSTDDLERANG